MIYRIIVWAILGISLMWITYECIHIKRLSVDQDQLLFNDNLIIRFHARLFIGLIIMWWIVNLLVNAAMVEQVFEMNIAMSSTLMIILVPIFLCVICLMKSRVKHMKLKKYIQSSFNISGFLNISTAFILASLVNYSIQMLWIII